MLSIKHILIQKLADAWNNLDISILDEYLGKGIVYESQWVMEPLKGRMTVILYLANKFENLRNIKGKPEGNIVATVGYLDPALKDPCLVITQSTSDGGVREMVVLIQVHKNKISRIDLCRVPSPGDVFQKDIS